MPAHLVPLRSRRRRAPVDLRLHVRPIADILPEVAHVAAELLVGLEAERDERHEAECEPLPALHGACRVVAAVLALEGLGFGAFEGGGEGCGVVSGGGYLGGGDVLCVPQVKKKNIVAVDLLLRREVWVGGF
jgi:hypothetical protein